MWESFLPDFASHAKNPTEVKVKKTAVERQKALKQRMGNPADAYLGEAPAREPAPSSDAAECLTWSGIQAYSKAEAKLKYNTAKIKFPFQDEDLATIINPVPRASVNVHRLSITEAEGSRKKGKQGSVKAGKRDDDVPGDPSKKVDKKTKTKESKTSEDDTDLIADHAKAGCFAGCKKAVPEPPKFFVYKQLPDPTPGRDEATKLNVPKKDVLPKGGFHRWANAATETVADAGQVKDAILNPIKTRLQQNVEKSAKNANDVMRLLAVDSRPCGKNDEDAVLNVVNPADYELFSHGLRKYGEAIDVARACGGDYLIHDEEDRIMKGGMAVAAGRMLNEDQEKKRPNITQPPWLQTLFADATQDAEEHSERVEAWYEEMELFFEDPAAYFKMKAWEKAQAAKTLCFDAIINNAAKLKSRVKSKIKKSVLRGKTESTILQILIFGVLAFFGIFMQSLVAAFTQSEESEESEGIIDFPTLFEDAVVGMAVVFPSIIVAMASIYVWTYDRRDHYKFGEVIEDVRLSNFTLRIFNRILHEVFGVVLFLLALGILVVGTLLIIEYGGASIAAFIVGFIVVVFNVLLGVLAAYAPAKLEKLLMRFAAHGGKRLLAFLKSKSITLARVVTAAIIAWAYCITGGFCISRKKKGSDEISLVTIREMKLAMYKEIERAREHGDNPSNKLDVIPGQFYDEYRNKRGNLDPFKYLKPPGQAKQDGLDTSGLCHRICDSVRYGCSCAWCPNPEFNPCLSLGWLIEQLIADMLRLIIVPISMLPCGCKGLDVKFFEDCAECFLDGWDCKELHEDCSAPDHADFGEVLPDYLPTDSIGDVGIITMVARDGKTIGDPVRGTVLWQGYDNFLPVPLVAVLIDEKYTKQYEVDGIDAKGKPTTHVMVHDALEPVTVKRKWLCCPFLGSTTKGGFDGKYLGRTIHPDAHSALSFDGARDIVSSLGGLEEAFENPFDDSGLSKIDDTRTLIVPASMVKIYTIEQFAEEEASDALDAVVKQFEGKRIQFVKNSWSLTKKNPDNAAGNETMLKELSRTLKAHETAKVNIHGVQSIDHLSDKEELQHDQCTNQTLTTAFPGMVDKSHWLASARASAVMEWLVADGVSKDRLTVSAEYIEQTTAVNFDVIKSAPKNPRRKKKAAISKQPTGSPWPSAWLDTGRTSKVHPV